MKYSEYLELVKKQLPHETFICHAADVVLRRGGNTDNLQKHDEELRNYIKKLLKKEDAMRRAVGDIRVPAAALEYVLGCPDCHEIVSTRMSLLNGHIAYHKARGN